MNSPVELTQDQIKAVGKTSLRKFQKPPLVYRCYFYNNPYTKGRLLDYGCGVNPVHVPKHGMEVVRYDICHYPKRPEGLFDVILVSNVLNVLPNEKTLVQAVGDIAGFLSQKGWVFVNFPSSPRKGRMKDGSVIDHRYVETLLNLAFREVSRSRDFGTKSAPVFICAGRK